MTVVTRADQIDALMERASAALSATRWFEAERLAWDALIQAHGATEYERMGRILLPLQEARRQRFQAALDASGGTIVLIEEPFPEEWCPDPGCYLVRPPLVGADARRLRRAALEAEVPAAIICREPATMLGDCPIVAIGPGTTVRTKIDPPDDPDHPDLAWFVSAMELLGEAAIAGVDPGLHVEKQLEQLLGRLEAIPEHEGLHQSAEAACRTARIEQLEHEATGGPPRRRRRRKK